MVRDEDALLDLLDQLKSRAYRFTSVTPATHERILARPQDGPPSLEDIFGWNRPFKAADLPPELTALLERAGSLDVAGDKLRSRVRVASIGSALFFHSSFPTSAPDAVFFGPDTYRFVRFILDRIASGPAPQWIADMGAGSGAGGIVLGLRAGTARLTLVDINPVATQLARVNARAAGVSADIVVSDKMTAGCDLVIANPPYMMDTAHRAYRDGGGLLGGELACSWVGQALQALAPGGRMLLYTGAAVSRGRMPLLEKVEDLCVRAGAELQFEEIDPDVFGEALDEPQYANVDRIAAVGISIVTPNCPSR